MEGGVCPFCDFPKEKILSENENIFIIRNRSPDAEHHYLVIPKEHKLNIRSLHSGHVSLLEEMTNFGDEFMKTVHPEVTTPIKMGYHLAPFNTVSHLHMHILSGNWKGLKKVAFWNNTLWFISNKNAIKKVQSKDI